MSIDLTIHSFNYSSFKRTSLITQNVFFNPQFCYLFLALELSDGEKISLPL